MKSHKTEGFRKRFERLPTHVQKRARAAYELWKSEPKNTSLQFKQVHASKPFYSVRVGHSWRAVGRKEDDTIIWFWLGSHAEYDHLLNQL